MRIKLEHVAILAFVFVATLMWLDWHENYRDCDKHGGVYVQSVGGWVCIKK